MSLNRYHKSRSEDNVFKLLHEEESYLDILKGNVKSVYQDEIEGAGGTHDTIRQQLLQEESLLTEQDPGVEAVEDSDIDEEKDDDDDDDDDEGEEKEKSEVKESRLESMLDKMSEDQLEEISIAVARQGAKRVALQRGAAARGMLRSKEPIVAMKKAAAKKKVLMGRV